MASADTRNLIQSIETTSATIAADKAAQDATNATNAAAIAAAQAAADTANSGVAAVNTVAAQITDEMVINEPFTIPVTAFVRQNSGLYHAVLDLLKLDGSKGIQLSLIDNDGDEQGFSQLIAKYNGNSQKVAIELTENQKNDGSYPLTLLCQGQRLMSATAPVTNFKQLGNRAHYYQLVNGTIDHSVDGATITDSMVMLNVVSAYMLTGNGRVYVALNDGTYFYIDGTQPLLPATETTLGMFDSTVSFPDRVAL